ncbi:small integral membrane protein 35 isoform X1 [Haemorhous mexicanus]|uniref:small integral membrane protein 35 isoform X1 n=1 Tax=Haemorhous mexicanus TaxID=30427 RepID=UPI0028BDAB8A|nr:small integral membrane protein 35 isoform X1 [Haemorhous mexicanus]XP_059723242.1 small integral membrane protein 35 isoform X1 [Haemorhous mexicanus]XP_059723243.1 small integral membrane protein 35 isoform X1 [Haemorhous mexicanus]
MLSRAHTPFQQDFTASAKALSLGCLTKAGWLCEPGAVASLSCPSAWLGLLALGTSSDLCRGGLGPAWCRVAVSLHAGVWLLEEMPAAFLPEPGSAGTHAEFPSPGQALLSSWGAEPVSWWLGAAGSRRAAWEEEPGSCISHLAALPEPLLCGEGESSWRPGSFVMLPQHLPAQGTWGWSCLMLTSCVTWAWAGHLLDNGILTVPCGNGPGSGWILQAPLQQHGCPSVPTLPRAVSIMSPTAQSCPHHVIHCWDPFQDTRSGMDADEMGDYWAFGVFLHFLQSMNLFCFKGIQSLGLPLHDSSQAPPRAGAALVKSKARAGVEAHDFLQSSMLP